MRIYHCHGLRYETAHGLTRLLLRRTEATSCALGTRVLTVSRSLEEMIIRDGMCPAEKVQVLLHGSIGGVDTARFHPPSNSEREVTRQAVGIPSKARVIGFVGRLVRDKGVVELCDAWKVLRARFRDVHWLVVGPFEEADAIPEPVASEMRRDPRIHLMGVNWDTPRMFAAMDVLVLPSRREGFPVVLLEAAAMGLPVVASRATGCSEAVVEGVTGTLFETGNVDALVKALTCYLEDPVIRRDHGIAARTRVLREFRAEELHSELQRVYETALASVGQT